MHGRPTIQTDSENVIRSIFMKNNIEKNILLVVKLYKYWLNSSDI